MPIPLLVAHRGASREAPENTLAAFERALAHEADGVELDVHTTADGNVLVHHDPVAHACPEAPELAGRPLRSLTLAEARRLRVRGHAIPTLPEVLDLVGERLTVFCELKGEGVVEHAAPLLAAHPGPCAMHAFDHRAVLRAAELAPAVSRGILVVSRLVDTSHALGAARASALWPQRDYVDEALVAEVHGRGGMVVAWTVNDADLVASLGAMGVDALCTDDVPMARKAVRSTFGERPA